MTSNRILFSSNQGVSVSERENHTSLQVKSSLSFSFKPVPCVESMQTPIVLVQSGPTFQKVLHMGISQVVQGFPERNLSGISYGKTLSFFMSFQCVFVPLYELRQNVPAIEFDSSISRVQRSIL